MCSEYQIAQNKWMFMSKLIILIEKCGINWNKHQFPTWVCSSMWLVFRVNRNWHNFDVFVRKIMTSIHLKEKLYSKLEYTTKLVAQIKCIWINAFNIARVIETCLCIQSTQQSIHSICLHCDKLRANVWHKQIAKKKS